MIVKKNQNKKELKTLCVIPARGGSKSLKEKNIQLMVASENSYFFPDFNIYDWEKN